MAMTKIVSAFFIWHSFRSLFRVFDPDNHAMLCACGGSICRLLSLDSTSTFYFTHSRRSVVWTMKAYLRMMSRDTPRLDAITSFGKESQQFEEWKHCDAFLVGQRISALWTNQKSRHKHAVNTQSWQKPTKRGFSKRHKSDFLGQKLR